MPIKMLVVDDEPDLELLITQKFRRQIRNGDYEFTFAHNGIQALEKLKEYDDIELMLTDINMPEMDGLTLLEKVKDQDYMVRSIVISAYGDMQNLRIAMNRGAFDFITKPIDFEDLVTTIDKTYGELKTIKEGMEAKSQVGQALEDKDRAEQSEKFKQQFLANMSHEIRTPMNAVQGMTSLLLKADPRDDQMKYLTAIEQSSKTLLTIINEILDLSKIEAGKMVFEETEFDVNDTLQNVHDILRFKSEEKGLDLSVDKVEGFNQVLIGDPTRLSQVLINLANNAIKFTNEGTIEVSAQITERDSQKVHIEFSVRDEGIGIPEERLETIFESFTQAGEDTTRKYGGTGLGLTISKKMVELQGGSIKVTSEVGKGSTFTFEIPYKVGSEVLEQTESSGGLDRDRLKNIRVLLAEDNDFNVMVAQDTLESEIEGIQVEVAENGRVALDKVQSGEYDLVLMDVNMPEMDGYTATEEIRKLSTGGKGHSDHRNDSFCHKTRSGSMFCIRYERIRGQAI